MANETYASLEDFRRKQLGENTHHGATALDRVLAPTATSIDAWIEALRTELDLLGVPLRSGQVSAGFSAEMSVQHPQTVLNVTYPLGEHSALALAIVLNKSGFGYERSQVLVGVQNGTKPFGESSAATVREGFNYHDPRTIIEALAGVVPHDYADRIVHAKPGGL